MINHEEAAVKSSRSTGKSKGGDCSAMNLMQADDLEYKISDLENYGDG